MIDKNKIIYALIAIIAIIGFVYTCNDSDRDQRQADVWKKESAKHRKSAEGHLKSNDSLKVLIAQLAQGDKKKVAEITAKEAEIQGLKAKLSDKMDEAAKDYPAFFSNRYQMNIDISPETAVSKIANDLIEGDIAKEESQIYKGMLILERGRIAGKDSIIGVNGRIITNLENAVSDFESALDASDKVIVSQNATIKKKTRQNVLLKISIPVAFVAGMLIK